MKRTSIDAFKKYLGRKIILISGPRQAGKTTLTRMMSESVDYLNYDSGEHRKILRELSWDRSKEIIIFDELHKMPKWKQWLKGVYDTEKKKNFIVTGSARLDHFKKVGDSLAGRYFHYRLYPLDVRELIESKTESDPKVAVEKLLRLSGFPEPYIEGDEGFYQMWKRTHLDIILRQDLVDLEDISSIRAIEILVDLLLERVGSGVSYAGLSRDLQVSDKTVKRWLEILENLYVVFKITPYSKKISRSILKQPKYYFYDFARVSNEGAALENLVAASLLKEIHFRIDTRGEDWGLKYLAKKGSGEIDFLVLKNGKPEILIEVKASDDQPSAHFKMFAQEFPRCRKVQLVKNLKREKTFPDGVEVRDLASWLVSW
jgi:predicted AAA+ superfamily ATPase